MRTEVRSAFICVHLRLFSFMNVYWLEQTEADLPAENGWLSASEVARLNSFCFAKRRADWRLGRWTAKRAVAAYLNAPNRPPALASIEIRPAPSGAPEVFVADQPADFTISLSHRGGVAACAVSRFGVLLGCDLELVEPRSEAFIADYFTPEEQALVAQADTADRFPLCALLWSAKESALKALRTGLRVDTRSVIVSPGDAFARKNRPQTGEAGGTACPTSGPAVVPVVSKVPVSKAPVPVEAVETVVAQAVPPGFLDACPASHPRLEPWYPLQIRHTNSEVFHGWWQLTGDLLRTLAADPRPAPPILLQI